MSIVLDPRAALPGAGDRAGPGPEAAALRELIRTALLYALRSTQDWKAPDGELQRIVRGVCAAATQDGLRAEQIVIIVKDSWRDLAAAREMLRGDGEPVLAHVITLCIEEYYAKRPPS